MRRRIRVVDGWGHANKSMLPVLSVWGGRDWIALGAFFASQRVLPSRSSMFTLDIQDLADKIWTINHLCSLSTRNTYESATVDNYILAIHEETRPRILMIIFWGCRRFMARIMQRRYRIMGVRRRVLNKQLLITKVVRIIYSQTVSGSGLPGRACTADFSPGLIGRDSILFASILTATWSGWSTVSIRAIGNCKWLEELICS